MIFLRLAKCRTKGPEQSFVGSHCRAMASVVIIPVLNSSSVRGFSIIRGQAKNRTRKIHKVIHVRRKIKLVSISRENVWGKKKFLIQV